MHRACQSVWAEGEELGLDKIPPSISSTLFNDEEIRAWPCRRHPVLLHTVSVTATSIKEFGCKDPCCLRYLPLECVQQPPCRCNPTDLLFARWDTDKNTSAAAENSATASKSCWEDGLIFELCCSCSWCSLRFETNCPEHSTRKHAEIMSGKQEEQ